MVTNEPKDINYYLDVFKKRKKIFIIPAVVVLLVAVGVALLLPPVYESSSTILIEEQQIPPDFVRSTVTGFADQRIQSLTQQIISRVKLWEIIQQFNLYADQRQKLTREEIIETMRDNIKFKTISAEVGKRGGGGAPVTIAFSVSFLGKNPEMVQKVAGTLASLYLEQNLKTREAQAQSTTKFLEAELKELQDRLQSLGSKITAFKEKNDGLLPEQQAFNRGQVEGLEREIQQIDLAISTAEDRKVYLQGQLATVKPDITVGERVMSPSDRIKTLELALADLQSKFSPDHPEIKKIQREVSQLKKMAKSDGDDSIRRDKLAELKAQLAEKQGRYSDEHPEVKKLKSEIAQLEKMPPPAAKAPRQASEPENPAYISLTTQIKSADIDMAALRQRQAALKQRLKMFQERVDNAPKVEQEYLALIRDYDNAHKKHQEVMNKILEARIAEGMEEHQKGEKFTLIDPASRPEKPVSPNRWLIFAAGAVLSLGAGFGMVALAENLDHSVKSGEELVRLTGVPVLGSIVRIVTPEDVEHTRRKRRLIWAIGCFSLIAVLLLFHFLFMDLWILTAKLLRLADKYT